MIGHLPAKVQKHLLSAQTGNSRLKLSGLYVEKQFRYLFTTVNWKILMFENEIELKFYDNTGRISGYYKLVS
jgi:hypothetical protein